MRRVISMLKDEAHPPCWLVVLEENGRQKMLVGKNATEFDFWAGDKKVMAHVNYWLEGDSKLSLYKHEPMTWERDNCKTSVEKA